MDKEKKAVIERINKKELIEKIIKGIDEKISERYKSTKTLTKLEDLLSAVQDIESLEKQKIDWKRKQRYA